MDYYTNSTHRLIVVPVGLEEGPRPKPLSAERVLEAKHYRESNRRRRM